MRWMTAQSAVFIIHFMYQSVNWFVWNNILISGLQLESLLTTPTLNFTVVFTLDSCLTFYFSLDSCLTLTFKFRFNFKS